jgi:hypothetical protein
MSYASTKLNFTVTPIHRIKTHVIVSSANNYTVATTVIICTVVVAGSTVGVPIVGCHVPLHVRSYAEGLSTDFTSVWLFASMNPINSLIEDQLRLEFD